MRNLSGLSAKRAADAPGRCVHRHLDDLAAPARPMPDVVKSGQDGTDARQRLRPCPTYAHRPGRDNGDYAAPQRHVSGPLMKRCISLYR